MSCLTTDIYANNNNKPGFWNVQCESMSSVNDKLGQMASDASHL